MTNPTTDEKPKMPALGVFREALMHRSDYGNEEVLTLVFGKATDRARYPVRFFTALTKGDTPQDVVVKLRRMADDIEKANG